MPPSRGGGGKARHVLDGGGILGNLVWVSESAAKINNLIILMV